MLSDAAYQDLENALGSENVSREPVSVLDSYCWQTLLNGGPDMWRPRPVAVTLPGSTEDVQAVVRICNAHALKCKAFSTGWGGHGSVGKEDVEGSLPGISDYLSCLLVLSRDENTKEPALFAGSSFFVLR